MKIEKDYELNQFIKQMREYRRKGYIFDHAQGYIHYDEDEKINLYSEVIIFTKKGLSPQERLFNIDNKCLTNGVYEEK